MYFNFLTAFVLISAALSADPWGKDADLTNTICSPCHKPLTPLTQTGIALIRFHQEVISPADGPRSHYLPSSSQYTLEAMCKYGFFKGVMMGCDRLMRENNEPWVYREILNPQGQLMKWDPVK